MPLCLAKILKYPPSSQVGLEARLAYFSQV